MKEDIMAQAIWSSLGTPGPLAGSPAVAQNADGRLEAFLQIRNPTTLQIYHIWQTSPGGGWSTWTPLNQPMNINTVSDTFVGRNADGRLELFIIGDGVLWHTWQTTANGDWNTTWFSSDRPPGVDLQVGLEVGSNTDGRLEAFCTGSDGAIWHIWQTTPNGTWSPWASLSTLLKPPANTDLPILPRVGRNADGRLELFTLTSDGALWHIWQATAGGNWNTNWFSSGKPSSAITNMGGAPAVIQNADGRLEAFTFDSDGAIWHIQQTTPNGTWSPWASLGTPPKSQFMSSPTVARNVDGRLEVFTFTPDEALWHIMQSSPGGNWGTWASLGATKSLSMISPTVSRNADGRLMIFAMGLDALWYASQVSPGGPWA